MEYMDKYIAAKVSAECAAGWGRGDTLPEALRRMIEYSRGFIDPRKTTLEKFIEMLDKQHIIVKLWLPDPTDKDSLVAAGYLGDEYNHAKIGQGGAG